MVTKALFVGGTAGIGYAMASRLAVEPTASIIVAGRHKPEQLPTNVEYRALDASLMRNIKRFTDEYKSDPKNSEDKLDWVVLTQGLLTTAPRTETAEGIDLKMALHYYGRQLVIRELLPVMKDDCKVIVCLDSIRGDPKQVKWDDMDLKNSFTLGNAAMHCMAFNDAMIRWHAANQGTSTRHFVHCFPRFVKTNISKSLPWYLRAPMKVLVPLVSTPADQYAEKLITGTLEVAKSGQKENRFYTYLDHEGHAVSGRPPWTDEQLEKVKEHTWKMVDEAIAKPI
ncbi:hypothetical protein B0I35DRAFT_426681 [Stachybotrys elegans]|uniref:Uncharacterized protein n=1 Tax=Stachybotrys elegans TaxID=80388 RepID=A0A8K0SWF9_9HYPO|nr:hypothetical protein B0I35DRAFT_426681 [Stachybotrys elegans]